MLNVVMLSVTMLNVVAPHAVAPLVVVDDGDITVDSVISYCCC
jgi:hypothetical protein